MATSAMNRFRSHSDVYKIKLNESCPTSDSQFDRNNITAAVYEMQNTVSGQVNSGCLMQAKRRPTA